MYKLTGASEMNGISRPCLVIVQYHPKRRTTDKRKAGYLMTLYQL